MSGDATPTRILFVEDAAIDAELASRVLAKAGVEHVTQRVDSEAAFKLALESFMPDVILSDHSMPQLDGMSALELAARLAPHIPFIFVSGTIGEEVAIESLKRGATDYILKNNMSRLPAAVVRAIHGSRERAAAALAQRQLHEAQQRFELFMRHLPGAAFIKDLDGKLQFANPAFEQIAGRSGEALLGRTDAELWPESADVYMRNDRWVARNNRVLQTFEERRQPDGVHSYLVHKFPIPDASGQPLLIGGVAIDFTARLEAERKLSRWARIHALTGGINSAILRTQDANEFLEATCRIAVEQGGFVAAWIALCDERPPCRVKACFGIAREQATGMLVAGEGDATVLAVLANGRSVILQGGTHGFEHHHAAALPIQIDGLPAGALVLHAHERQAFGDDEMRLLSGVAGDISFALDYLSKKQRLDYFAYYDPLTGLPNRALCIDRIDQVLQAAHAGESNAAVLVLDLERFSLVNDSLGRHAGDELLKLVGARLQESIAHAGTVARIGPDEYAIVLPELRADVEAARLIDERIWRPLSRTFEVGGERLHVSAKCGVAIGPADGDDAESLLRNAAAALKSLNGSPERCSFYAAPMNARVAELLALENDLRRAVSANELEVHYQPKIDLRTGRIYGFEALLRWTSPRRGVVPPNVFVPILESTGMIIEVGTWVLRQAARDLAAWLDWDEGLRVAVNVSSMQLRRREFCDEALRAIAQEGGDTSRFDLEITESVIMENIEGYVPVLRTLRDAGMGVEIDDFGTGYSSLAYLARLPVTALKIDRSFVAAMSGSNSDRTIISTIVSLAHLMRLQVIAEGVETTDQRRALAALGCDRAQGFLFSRAVPANQVAQLLERDRERAPAVHSARSGR